MGTSLKAPFLCLLIILLAFSDLVAFLSDSELVPFLCFFKFGEPGGNSDSTVGRVLALYLAYQLF